MNDWDGTKLVKFNHSGKDVYEDPYFTVIVKVPANCYWKIIPQSNLDAGNVWANLAFLVRLLMVILLQRVH